MGRRRERKQQPIPDPGERDGLWVSSAVAPDGSYVTEVTADRDHAWVLTPEQGTAYADVVLAAAARAETDGAILRLMMERLNLPKDVIVNTMGHDIRPDRPALDDAATRPLQFVPGVNAQGKGFIAVHLDGKPWGQVSPTEARMHALAVLEVKHAVDLDAQFYRVLRHTVGVPEKVARAATASLFEYRGAPGE